MVPMRPHQRIHAAAKWVASAAGVAAAGYVASTGLAWYRSGEPPPADDNDRDALLDRFMPVYDVVERHQIKFRRYGRLPRRESV
jgi:hypothetical protein